MVHIFEDGTKLKVPWDYPTLTNQGLRFASKIAFNCLAAVALTVRSIQLGLGSISKELTEDCGNHTEDCGNHTVREWFYNRHKLPRTFFTFPHWYMMGTI